MQQADNCFLVVCRHILEKVEFRQSLGPGLVSHMYVDKLGYNWFEQVWMDSLIVSYYYHVELDSI